MGEKHILTIPGRYTEIKRICQFVADGAASVGLDETAVFHIELACDEASANIIEHAYGGENIGEIQISWHVADNMFVVTMLDNGKHFDPDSVPAPPSSPDPPQTKDIDSIKIGGLGIHFMRKMMDEVAFSRDPRRGNKLVMKKRIKAERQSGETAQ